MFDEFSFETLHHNAFRLTLKNYRLPVEIGALAEEHGRTQPVVITIDVWVKKTNLNDDPPFLLCRRLPDDFLDCADSGTDVFGAHSLRDS